MNMETQEVKGLIAAGAKGKVTSSDVKTMGGLLQERES